MPLFDDMMEIENSYINRRFSITCEQIEELALDFDLLYIGFWVDAPLSLGSSRSFNSGQYAEASESNNIVLLPIPDFCEFSSELNQPRPYNIAYSKVT